MTKRPRIYLDHAATTPILPAAKAAMMEAMARWANPSSPHAEGRAARAALEEARERIKRALGWEGELIFTSGATEAVSLAFRCAKRDRDLISPVEHDCVVRAAAGADKLPLDGNGEVDKWVLRQKLTGGGKALVAVQHANPETGKIQPVSSLAEIVREAGGVTLCDAAQSGGRFPLPDADLVVLSAHKLGGPPGMGALLVRDLRMLEAVGGQERGYRGGTENLPGAVGFATAMEFWREQPPAVDLLNAVDGFIALALGRGGRLIGHSGAKIRSDAFSWHIEALAMPTLPATTQLIKFDLAGIAVSAGSACSSGSMKASRVLAAFGVSADEAARTIRVSFGWNSTCADLEAFGDTWFEIAEDARKRAA